MANEDIKTKIYNKNLEHSMEVLNKRINSIEDELKGSASKYMNSERGKETAISRISGSSDYAELNALKSARDNVSSKMGVAVEDNTDIVEELKDDLKSKISNTNNASSSSFQSSITLSTDSEIFFDSSTATNEFNSITDKVEVLIDKNAKLNSLLNDINDYWGGSFKDIFVANAQSYIETINKYLNYIDTKRVGLQNANKAYSKLDETFTEKEI